MLYARYSLLVGLVANQPFMVIFFSLEFVDVSLNITISVSDVWLRILEHTFGAGSSLLR